MKKTNNFVEGITQIYIYISTVVAVAFSPLSLTEGIWIYNFVATLTLVCFAVQRRYHKVDKNNQVDVNVLLVAIYYVNLAATTVERNNFILEKKYEKLRKYQI